MSYLMWPCCGASFECWNDAVNGLVSKDVYRCIVGEQWRHRAPEFHFRGQSALHRAPQCREVKHSPGCFPRRVDEVMSLNVPEASRCRIPLFKL